jgi:hypothetical protein
MRVLPKLTDLSLELSPTESRALRGALAEVCFGFEVPDFERVIGCTPPFARQLFNRLDGLDLDHSSVVTIRINELRAIRNAHVETLRVLGAEEYQTRTGVPFIEGERIARELDDLLNRLPGH